MEHRRDVPGGDLRACTACGSCRGPPSASGSQGFWSVAGDGTEDAAVRSAAGRPAATADQAAQAGAVARRDRRHSPTPATKTCRWGPRLDDDKQRPAKQRHTAKRIFERLKEEHGFTGGYARRNFMVPIPRVSSWEELNTRLEAESRKRRLRRLRGHTETFALAEVTHAVEDALLLGTISFDAVRHLLCRIEQRPPRLDIARVHVRLI